MHRHAPATSAQLLMTVVLGQVVTPPSAQTVTGTPPARLGAARQIVDEAVRLAGTIQDPRGLGALRTLATAQARAGDVPGALRSMAAVPTNLPDLQTTSDAWSAIATAQARAGDVSAALATLAKTFPNQSKDDALGGIAARLAAEGDVQGAMATAATIADPTTSDRTLWTIAEGQIRGGDATGALRTLKATPLGAHPELAMTMASLEAKQGNLAEARRFLARVPMPERDVGSLLGLAAYHARAGDVPGALALANRIPPDSSHGGAWHYLALLAVVAGQAAGGDTTGALATAAAHPRIEPAGRAIVAEALARHGQLQAASQILATVSPDADVYLVRAVTAVAVAHAERGDVAGAFRTIQLAPHSGAAEEAFTQVAVAQVFAGDPAGAIATASRIPDHQGRTRARWRVAVARARAGDPAPLLAAANPSGSIPAARVTDLALAALDVLDDRRFDPDEPGAYLGTQRPRWTR
jgi:hypothetical protein